MSYHSNIQVLLSESQQIIEELGNIYAVVGGRGLCSEEGAKLRALSKDVHDLFVIKERCQKSLSNSPITPLHQKALENMLGKTRQAMFYFKKDMQQPVMTI